MFGLSSVLIIFSFPPFLSHLLIRLFQRYPKDKHCQRHNGPEGWVHLSKVTYLVILFFVVSYSASESLCTNGILLFAFLLQSVVPDDLFAGLLYWNAFICKLLNKITGGFNRPICTFRFSKNKHLKLYNTDPLTHQLICLHRHLDFYWMTRNTCDSSQDCKVDNQIVYPCH